MNLIQRIFRGVFALTTAKPGLTVSTALLLAALSILYTAFNLDFETSQRDLINPRTRIAQLMDQLEPFEDVDSFVVVIENRDRARSLAFLHALVSRLWSDGEHYHQVFFRTDPRLMRPWLLLFLDKEDLLTLGDNLREYGDLIERLRADPGLATFLRELNREMASRMVGELFTGFLEEGGDGDEKKPMNLEFLIDLLQGLDHWIGGREHFRSPWGSFFAGEAWKDEAEQGYFWTGDDRYLLAFVTPRLEDRAFADAQSSLKALRATIQQVRGDFPDIQVGVTGENALGQDEMGAAFHDMSVATLLSLGGLGLLLVLFWRGVRRPILEIIELLVALCTTFGLTTLFIGHLNILTVTFAPLLLGLGIDYGIHWFAWYREDEALKGRSKKEAVEATVVKLGPGILLAGLTASLSFFPLVITGFKGLVELGIICSMGMMMTTVTTLCLLPALTLLFDRSNPTAEASDQPGHQRHLLRLSRPRALAILIPGGVAVGLAVWGGAHVRFDLNLLRLQSKQAESVVWEKKLLEGSERSSIYGASLARNVAEVRRKAKAFKALPSVSEVYSIESLLPDDQEEKIALLRKMRPLLDGVGLMQASGSAVDIDSLENSLGRIRFKMTESSAARWGANRPLRSQMRRVQSLIDKLTGRFEAMERTRLIGSLGRFEKAMIRDLNDKLEILLEGMDARPLRLDDLPKPLLDRVVAGDDRFLIRVLPAKNVWEPEQLGKFVREMRSVDPDVVGPAVTTHIFTQAFRNACIQAAAYAVVLIFLLLLMAMRRFVDATLAMAPLVVGTVWTVGLMRVSGVDFNLANSLFIPLVVGAGVEYGIMIVRRWRQMGAGNPDVVLLQSTAKGVILAGLTTTVGFGSLAISDHQGIHSLGVLAIIGSLSILVAAVLFLPALIQVLPSRLVGGRLNADRP